MTYPTEDASLLSILLRISRELDVVGDRAARRPGLRVLRIEDGDEVTLRYTAPGTSGGRIALGEVTGRIVPAR